MEFLVTAIFILGLLGFALLGFIVALKWLFSAPKDEAPSTIRSQRFMGEDAIGACHLLNHLYSEKQITTESYKRIRGIIEFRFGSMASLPSRIALRDDETVEETSPAEFAAEPEVVVPAIAEIPTSPPEFAAPAVSLSAPESVPVAEVIASSTPAPAQAPWEMPDPPPREPRKSFNDVLAAFMQEKNIRWGELASGILIVGSAVGLVVSLRNELTRTIPYFPALLFLLITAAIHAAGSYTLKKWKLRKTSRGTLLIGLLLIPLNFLAASLLSGSEQLRRPLNDPLYWTTIILGCSAFGAMTWWSSKQLLKRGHWPMVIGVMGAAVMTLMINRLDFPPQTSWTVLLASLPLAMALLVGTGVLSRTIRSNRTWNDRTLNRMHMLLGLALFACLTAVALMIVRAADRTFAISATMPLVVVFSLVTAWSGLIAHAGLAGTKLASQSVVSRALTILGSIIAAIALVVSTANPTILMVNGAVAALLGWIIFRDRKMPSLMPMVWAGMAIALVCGVNLGLNQATIDTRTGLAGLRDMFCSGQSGLSLMALGLWIGAAYGVAKSAGGIANAKSVRRLNLISAGVIGGLGCLLALVAGLLNRESQFDTMTASALLGIASVVTLGLASTRDRPAFPHLAAIVLFGFLAFTCLWNPTTAQWLDSVNPIVDARLLTTLALHGLIVAAAACVASVRISQAPDSISAIATWASITSAMAIVAGLLLAPEQSGVASTMMVVVVATWTGIVWSYRKLISEASWPTALMLAVSLCLVVVLIDNSARLGVGSWKEPQHWLIQATMLAAWSIVWATGRLLFGNRGLRWLFDHDLVRGESIVQFSLLAGLMGLLGTVLWEANARQLVAGFDSTWFIARDHVGLCMTAVLVLFVSVAMSFVLRRTLNAGLALAVVWVLAWSVPSLLFDGSCSAGSAMRWLLSASCVVTAGIVASRKMWLKSGDAENNLVRSNSGRTTLNVMIDWFLTISVGIVILVSSATVARVMLSESQVAALGGPIAGSWFARIPMEVSYGVPVGMVTAAFLMFAIFESRQWLATIGSAVYQYMVLFSIVLLYLSPHPKLATGWFLNILQAVSLGMSVYGMVWFVFRARVRGTTEEAATEKGWLSQIEFHSAINALLVTSLAVLVGWRFFSTPWTTGGWINAAGGPLGLIALALVSGLLFLVARDRIRDEKQDSLVVWMAGWFGMVLVAMVAANIDRTVAVPWIGLRTIEWGSVATLAIAGGLAVYFYQRAAAESERSNFAGPIWIASTVALLFAIRGGLVDRPDIWQYTMAIATVVVVVTAVGVLIRSLSAQYIGVAGLFAGTVLLRRVNPNGAFPTDQPDWINLFVVLLCVLSGIWSIVHVLRRNREATSHGFAILPNVVLLGSAIWVLLGGLMQWMLDSNSFLGGSGSVLANGMGLAAVGASIGLGVISLWHERVFVRVSAGWLISIGVAIATASVITTAVELENDARFLWVMCALAVTILGGGIVWLKQNVWRVAFTRWNVARIGAIESGLSIQVPVFGAILGMFVLTSSSLAVMFVEPRSQRYLAAMTPFLLAFGFGCMSDQGTRRMFQIVSLAIATLGFVLVGWADLPAMNRGNDELSWLVRLVLVLAGLMFVYGALVTRWTRVGDSWLRSLREMTVAICAVAVLGLGLLDWSEQSEFVDGIGCGVNVVEASSLAVVVVGMIVGLITIAMRPKLDPFAMPESGRTAYVYAAQAVAVLLIGHLYWTMPWLFQFELRHYCRTF